MPGSVLVDAGFLAALLDRRDNHHLWAAGQAAQYPPPWRTCEAVVTEAFYLLQTDLTRVISLFQRRVAVVSFDFDQHLEPVLALMLKYEDVPMSLADACLVRMTEIQPDPIVLTTDSDFRVYRRHSRHVVPCVLPG